MTPPALPLKIVDGLQLPEAYRAALRPDEEVEDASGMVRRLPRYFYEVPSWKAARETRLAPDFGLYEFINLDLYEAELLRGFPRYVPCAIVTTAAQLALLRDRVGTYVHIAANGGYRSPSHDKTRPASPHCWGTAVNVYRVGDDYLEDQDTIERYRAIVQETLPGAWTRPYGHSVGYADDHLHIDFAYTTLVPYAVPR